MKSIHRKQLQKKMLLRSLWGGKVRSGQVRLFFARFLLPHHIFSFTIIKGQTIAVFTKLLLLLLLNMYM